MICPKCQFENADGAIFCSKCGKKFKNESKQKEKSHIAPIILVFIAALAVVIGAIILISINTPINKWKKMMENDSYSLAVDCFNQNESSISANEENLNSVIDITSTKAESIYSMYKNEEIAYEEALAQIEELGKMSVVSEKMKSYTNRVTNVYNSRQEFQEGEKSFSDEKYDEAMAHYANVIEEDGINYESAQDKVEKCVELYRTNILSEAEELKNSNNLTAAMAMVDEGLKILENDEEFLKTKADLETLEEEQKTQELLSTVEEFRKNGELDRALKNINKYKGKDEKVVAIKAQVEAEYEEYVDNTVHELILAKDVDAAKKLINDAQNLYSASEVINEWSSKIDDYYPIRLNDMNVFTTEQDGINSRPDWKVGSDYDNMDNTDYFGFEYSMYGYYGTSWREDTYVLDGKYDTFSGIWATTRQSKNNTKDKYTAYLSIYGDGALLYKSPNAKGGVYPLDFEVDISNVNELVVRVDCTGNYHVALLNPELMKTLE